VKGPAPDDVAALGAPDGSAPRQDLSLRRLDEAPFGREHRRTILVAGMGFLADAYDLFVIGVVTTLLTPIWHLTTAELSLLNSASLLAAVVGALVFGKVADRLGRKRSYGLEVGLLMAGALLSAAAPTFASLVACRAIVGLGIGGDYSSSAVITAEFANRRDRGKMIAAVFAMQGVGLLLGPAIAAAGLALGIPSGIWWRVLLALGALPAASVVLLRRRLKESPRFAAAPVGPSAHLGRGQLRRAPWWWRLVGTAGTWFLLDLAFYGNSISAPVLLHALDPHATLESNVLATGLVFLVAAAPGYVLAIVLIDRLGRKAIQLVGFLVMAMAFLLIWLVPGIVATPDVFLVVFGLSYLFIEFGPNVTTFVYPTEVFPTKVRGTADGISAASGKIGAFLGALLIPTLVARWHLAGVEGMLGIAAVLGALLTLLTLPETKRLTLEEASDTVDA